MSFLDENGNPLGNDSDYEYTGKIGKASQQKGKKGIILGYLWGIIFLLPGVFLLYEGLRMRFYDYLWGAAFFILFSGYIFYKVSKYIKQRKEMEQALKDFEESKGKDRR